MPCGAWRNNLSNLGLRAPCRIIVDVYNGDVTLKGVVQYGYQKRTAIQAVRSVDGVHRVDDQLKIEAPEKRWDEDEPSHEAPS